MFRRKMRQAQMMVKVQVQAQVNVQVKVQVKAQVVGILHTRTTGGVHTGHGSLTCRASVWGHP
jgi:hypothetical protein